MKNAINIRLELEMLSRLDEGAKELNKTRTYLIAKAIEHYWDTLDEMIADKRIDDLKSGKSSLISLEEVFAQARLL